MRGAESLLPNPNPQPRTMNETPAPTIMTKEEAIARLCNAAQKSADPDFLRAAVIAAKCLARDGVHHRRWRKSRSARGLPPVTDPSAPALDAAETKPETQD